MDFVGVAGPTEKLSGSRAPGGKARWFRLDLTRGLKKASVVGFDGSANFQPKPITLVGESTQRIFRNKVGLRNLAGELGNVSRACQLMGVSRDTFYRYKSAKLEGGVDALPFRGVDTTQIKAFAQ